MKTFKFYVLGVALTAVLMSSCSLTGDPFYSIGGTATGVTGDVVLSNNGVDSLTIDEDGSFFFRQKIKDGDTYEVEISETPSDLDCTLDNASGEANGLVDDVALTCEPGGGGATVAICSGIYVTAPDENAIAVFGIDNVGNVVPTQSFEGDPELDNVRGLTCSNGELFLTDQTAGLIYVYAANATGTAEPIRTISGANTLLDNPRGIIVVDDEIFVTSSDFGGTGFIHVFDVTDDGNVAPKRTISGGNTQLFIPNFLAHHNGELFVSETQGNSIVVFNTTDDGNVTPQRLIDGMLTAIETPRGIAVDGTNIYLADNEEIHVYDINDDGAMETPNETISGANTLLETLGGLSVYNDEIFVVNEGGTTRGVLVFATTDTGNVAPDRVITGSNTTIDGGAFDVFVAED